MNGLGLLAKVRAGERVFPDPRERLKITVSRQNVIIKRLT
jgi:hypothetical protein